MINVVCGIRSTGRICSDLATALESQGHEVKIAYGREEVPDQYKKYAVRIGSELDVKLHGLRARLFDGCGFGSRKATEKFIKWVREYNPDVIHLHNIHGYYINIEVLFDYLRTCGKKIIWTLHDCWAFTGHSAYCDAINCTKWIEGCYSCPNKREYPSSLIDNSKYNWEKKKTLFSGIPNLTIVSPSKWLAGLVKKSFLSDYPVKVIHNGIDTSKFFPMENDFKSFYGIENKYMLLGVATSWDDMKGYSDFIKLADLLGDNYIIVLVGLTKSQIEKLPGNILGIEKTNSIKELAQIYSAADLFLNLSYCENYPTVNLEAVSCGTPVLTYETECDSKSDVDGLVVKRGDINAVADAVKRIIASKPLIPEKTVKEVGYWKYKNSLGLLGKKILLGVAAIWDKRKGLDDLIGLSGNPENQLIIVGIDNKLKKRMPSSIISISRTNNVEELRLLYSVADYYINPTYEDNLPTTNIEALACGTPVITYNTGGSPEIAQKKAGIVVKKGDIWNINYQVISEATCLRRSMCFNKKLMVKEYLSNYLSFNFEDKTAIEEI